MTAADETMTIQQLAEWLQLPVQTIYKMRHEGKAPPGAKVGRQVRFRRRDVDAWFERLATS